MIPRSDIPLSESSSARTGVPAAMFMPVPRPLATPAGHYFGIVRRYGSRIFFAVVLAVAAAYGVSSLITLTYEATATVDIDMGSPAGVLGADSRQVSSLDSDQFMATQMKLIQSDSVLRRIAQKYHLLELEKQDRGSLDLPATVFQNAPVVLKKLRVNRPPNTFLIQISYRSPDRELSSSVANEIANSYIRHTYDLRYQSAEGVSAFMEKQLEQLKAKMETSSDRLAAFERDLNVADPEQKTAILSSRLIQLNNEYATAEADRLRKEAAFHSTQDGAPEAAEASTQGEALKQLTERLSEAKERFASVKGLFGKNFPEYRKGALEVDELQAQLDQARGSISKRVEIEFRQAVNRENMLAGVVGDLKKEFDALNAKTFEYQTVKRDAEADKKLYEELDQKIKEAGINVGFQNSSIRIADPARPPLKPVSPDIKINLLIAFCLSACGSFLVAVAVDKRDATVHDAEIVSSSFLVRVVGSLPRVKGRNVLVPAAVSQFASAKKPIALERMMFDEAIQALRSALLLAPENAGVRCLAVTSPLPGDGKTVTACHLAVANARKNRRTLLIDLDLRRPTVDLCLGVQSSTGLKDVLLGNAPWRGACRKAPDLPDLDILSIGQGGLELAGLTSQISTILESVRDEYDLVIVDSPPILGFSTPLEIAACVDAVLLVAVAGETNSRLLGQCITSLRQVGANNLNLVLNKVTAISSGYGYYGHYLKQYKRYSRTA